MGRGIKVRQARVREICGLPLKTKEKLSKIRKKLKLIDRGVDEKSSMKTLHLLS